MKTICYSLLIAVLAAAPFEASQAESMDRAETSAVLHTQDQASFAGDSKYKRKKRKKNRAAAMRRRRMRMRGF